MRTPAAALVLLAACASSPIPKGEKPVWVVQASADPRFPPERFYAAVGTAPVAGKDVLAAVDASARAALTSVLREKIPADLSGQIVIEGRWRDGDLAYAHAVLDREKALAQEQERANAKVKAAQELVAQAAAAAPAEALQKLARARVEADEALAALPLLRALGSRQELPEPGADAQAKLDALLGSLVVTVVDGDQQRAAPGQPLAQPIVLSVWLGGKAAAGLPLVARIEGGRAEAALVGADGRASLRVADIGRFAAAEQPVAVAVDWPRVLGVAAAPAWTAALSKPVASAVALRRGVGTTRVLVLLSEKVEGGDPVSEPPVTAQLNGALRTAGFAVQDRKAFTARLRGEGVARLTIDELKKQARGFADVVVFGTVTSRAQGGAVSARADVRAIDVSTGQVMFQSAPDEVPGKRPGELNVAGRAALEALGHALTPSLEKTLRGAAAQ